MFELKINKINFFSYFNVLLKKKKKKEKESMGRNLCPTLYCIYFDNFIINATKHNCHAWRSIQKLIEQLIFFNLFQSLRLEQRTFCIWPKNRNVKFLDVSNSQLSSFFFGLSRLPAKVLTHRNSSARNFEPHIPEQVVPSVISPTKLCPSVTSRCFVQSLNLWTLRVNWILETFMKGYEETETSN